MFRDHVKTIATIVVVCVAQVAAGAAEDKGSGNWVSAWSTAVHTPLPFPGLPPTPVFEKQTVRMVARLTRGGVKVRIRFSNAYGTAPLEIGAAHVALTERGAAIVGGSDRALTFDGRPSVTIPAGAPALSDPVDLKVSALGEVSISLYLPHRSTATTTHFWGQHETYVAAGDVTGTATMAQPQVQSSWYWLSDVEVTGEGGAGAVVAFGDSITDGAGAKQGDYADWPDQLADRLAARGEQPRMAVLNEGIGGNRILHDGAGINALARFDRDVLAQPGVTDVIILEGINDIGWPHMKPRAPKEGGPPRPSPFADQGVTAEDLIAGMRQMIDRAHQHHLRVYGATLTPYEGADYFTQDGEKVRQEVNEWMRSGGAFDGVIDFDAAVRDPSHPARFREDYQSGDHLHPSASGYKAMAEAVDLSWLAGTRP